ncbi:MAG: methylmalonyl-CoA epimerase [Ardenticatenaceae bacterium]|nr:methylmalonyl-CoA epimerase [Anaerolineales bacterium]MCB8921190.1 methylmalonyl-CoA epimerase [Ardenticatenaceae bacterium]MCB9004262.1 methylmalonyl-CoA epimerase [Ardenticatenaceae bacterium]
MITKINHIAIVAPDLDEAMGFWVEALGLPVSRVEDVPAEAVKVAFLPIGESNLEILQPTDESSGVARYLEKRGPGMHHICLEVDDIEAALAQLKAANVPLINDEPQSGHHNTRYAFIHPKGTGGVLVELYEVA